ncbi:hypothetical protein [Massilia yuzhufengensis]|uniref:Uncharacterized protein n=1 Tax=Massilia yuzhufengensis TaxID=1164594 RepID=A0A1I1VMY1_9BURK|nr:hypothetical protein [Massilia yuzhufengensis]SFD84376.1 hypothetical protein SAMN05216204_14055 [Massilia yuzhufengensis]
MREVTEQDLRAPQYREGKPDEYEIRDDGKIVRKDRFVRGMQDIAAILFGARHQYEIAEVVAAVHRMQGVRAKDLIEQARDVFESEPKALECLDYMQAVIDTQADRAPAQGAAGV